MAGNTGLEIGLIDWQKRCQALEASLLKFKEQALRIRALLGSKIEELEKRCSESEERSAKAEKEVGALQQKLKSIEWEPDEMYEQIQQLEKDCVEKDQENEDLRQQIEEQKQLRRREAQLVEDKAAQIREWVISRLRELELQNEALKYERCHLTEKIDILTSRLHSLPSHIAKEIFKSDQQPNFGEISHHASPDEHPTRPSSMVMDMFQKEDSFSQDCEPCIENDDSDDVADDDDDDDIHSPLDANGNISEDLENEPEYQEIDENHESKYEPLKNAPPKIKIERKIFHSSAFYDSVISANSEDYLLDSLTTPRLSRVSPPEESTKKQKPDKCSKPINPQFHDISSIYSGSSCLSCGSVRRSRNVSAIATLPRVRHHERDNLTLKVKPAFDIDVLVSDKETTEQKQSSQMECDSSAVRNTLSKPPTPPLHRRPSWENRIYAVANSGIQYDVHLSSSSPDSPNDHIYRDVSVPVYSNFKGRAALIRSKPFSGESSSDSSDNEDCEMAMTTGGESEAVMTVAGPSRLTTTSVTVIGSVNPSGATKRVVSTVSSESSDYCLPPDDDVSISSELEHSEPEVKLLKYTAQTAKKEILQKSGYMTKLGGKVKNWHRKWFVLQQGELFYYKSENVTQRKPQGQIFLDSQTRITKSDGANTFEIATSKKTYYLIANSIIDMEEWIKVLQNVLKRKAAYSVIQHGNAKIIMKGWMTKCKNGLNRRKWFVLIGKYLVYYRTPTDKSPTGQIHLVNSRVQEIDTAWDSDEEFNPELFSGYRYTIAVWPPNEGPVYLIIPSKAEMDSWLYYITIASGGGLGNTGTEYEQIVSKLLSSEGDPNSHYWKHPAMLVTKEPIPNPLTTLPTDEMKARAIDLFKSCHLFMNVGIESPSIDYHVNLAQNILHTCLQYPELQSEIYAQLIKQTSPHPPQHKHAMQNILLCGSNHWFLCDASSSASMYDLNAIDSKFNPSSQVFIQGWQLLAMCVALFVPRQGLLWYLKAHLHRNVDPRSEVGKYAIFCQRALVRAVQNGPRENQPSRLEILSILLRNPFHHSLPISIPVHFMNGTYQVVSFDGSSTVEEVMQSLTKLVGVRYYAQSGFALYSDDPSGKEIHHYLQLNKKLCDVISQWENMYLEQHKEKEEVSRTIKLIYKNRLYFRHMMKWETEKEKLLLCYHINHDIIRRRFPTTRELAIELASLLAQIEFGDCKSKEQTEAQTSQQLGIIIDRFYPKRFRSGFTTDEYEQREVMESMEKKWISLKSQSQQECVRIYLNATRKWPFFGAKLYSAKLKGEDDMTQVWLAVLDEGISILNYSTMDPMATYMYKNIVTFGGCKDDFMIVSRFEHKPGTDRRFFVMSKVKVIEVTQLMAAYINTKPQRPSFSTTSTTISQISSRTPSQSQSRATSSTSELRTPGSTKSSQNFSLPKASMTETTTF
ncbi:pleckstrin homology domain-containing family H member 1-like [Tubulanus polymorphus]|uniref:pleckstrin homology domain-containing family H member 1-like n=1 Tax=Tubulanus polymorphus TaxID=672921 RepID=UPI003DA2525F